MIRKEKSSKYLDQKIPVLSNNQYVELCDYMGNDESIVRTARQSYGKDNDEIDEKIIDNQIKNMLINGHTSPFEQVVFQFHICMPIFVQRQFVRHRTARINEISGRYTTFSKDNFYVPGNDVLKNRKDFSNNTDLDIIDTDDFKNDIIDNNNLAYKSYLRNIDKQLPYELSRISLPLTLLTEFYWQIDLHNLLHFLELRMDEHAQKEIRQYAITIYKIVKDICPITMKHFMNYQFNSIKLGQEDIKILNYLLALASLYKLEDKNVNESIEDEDIKKENEFLEDELSTKIMKTYEKHKNRIKFIDEFDLSIK
jgi:thymidylate synthase (FAD)